MILVGEYMFIVTSTGPHLHFERRSANGIPIDPGNVLPVPNGRITTPYGQTDRSHTRPHSGIDFY